MKGAAHGATAGRIEWSDGTTQQYKRNDLGWELVTHSRGTPDDPVLMMLHTVRVGASWTSADLTFEVLSRQFEMTPWGKRVVWRVEKRIPGYDEPEITTYVEGRGLRKQTGFLDFREMVGGFYPLDDQTVVEPKMPASTLVPLRGPDEAPLVLKTEGRTLFAIEFEPGHALLGVTGQGYMFEQSYTTVPGGYIESLGYTLVNKNDCLLIGPQSADYLSAPVQDTGIYRVDQQPSCHNPGPSLGEANDRGFTHYKIHPWVSPETGDVFAMDDANMPSGGEGWAIIGTPGLKSPKVLGTAAGSPRYTSWGNKALHLQAALLDQTPGLLRLQHYDPTVVGFFTPPLLQEPKHPLGIITSSGVLAVSALAPDLQVGRPSSFGFVGFNPHVTTSAARRSAIVIRGTTFNELDLDADGATLRRLASVSLPTNHFITSAYRVGEEVIVTTGNRRDTPEELAEHGSGRRAPSTVARR